MTAHRVLVVEDDHGVRSVLARGLREEGFHVTTAADGASALRMVEGGADAVVLDVGLPDSDGRDVCQALRARGIDVPVGSYIAISHFHNPGAALPAVGEHVAAGEKLFNERLGTGRWRTREEILAYFGGLEPIEPGLVPLLQWRPSPEAAPHVDTAAELAPLHYAFLGGVARKP